MRRGMLQGLVLLVAVAAPAGAMAGGLFTGDAGSQGQQRAGAFVAKADDPTAIYYNPAGLVKARRFQLYLGANVLDMNLSYQRSGTYLDSDTGTAEGWAGQPYPLVEDQAGVQPVPFLAATQRFGRLAFGEGVWGPQGMPGRQMPAEVAVPGATDLAPAPQRYDMVEQEALLALPSIGAAYRVLDWIDVGARVTWGFGNLRARTFLWATPNTSEDPGNDADFTVDASDSFIPAFGLGVLARPAPYLELGLVYNSGLRMRAEGIGIAILGDTVGAMGTEIEPVGDEYALCAPGGRVGALAACVNLDTPQTATIGGRYILRDGGREIADVELDVRWENWSAAKDTEIIVDGIATGRYIQKTYVRRGYRDVFSTRLGGSYRLPVGGNPLELRAGVSYDTAAAPVSWTRVDMDGMERYLGALGLAYELGRYRIDLGGAYVFSPPRDVVRVPLTDDSVPLRVQPDPIQALEELNNQAYSPHNEGHYESSYWLVSAGLTAAF